MSLGGFGHRVVACSGMLSSRRLSTVPTEAPAAENRNAGCPWSLVEAGVELGLYDRNEMPGAAADEWTRNQALIWLCPFLALLVHRETANQYKPVQRKKSGSHWRNEENCTVWIICKSFQKPAR